MTHGDKENMKKWYDEEYEFTIEVTGFLHGDHTERYCRNGEEIGDVYKCTYVGKYPIISEKEATCSKLEWIFAPRNF